MKSIAKNRVCYIHGLVCSCAGSPPSFVYCAGDILAYISSVLYLPRYIYARNENFGTWSVPGEYLKDREDVGTLRDVKKKDGMTILEFE